MAEKFYITTPIFYPNAKLHMGHAYTVTLCDIIARAQKLQGKEVYFLTGADENTGKIKKIREEKLVRGYSVTDVEAKVTKRYETFSQDWRITSVSESKIDEVFQ